MANNNPGRNNDKDLSVNKGDLAEQTDEQQVNGI